MSEPETLAALRKMIAEKMLLFEVRYDNGVRTEYRPTHVGIEVSGRYVIIWDEKTYRAQEREAGGDE